MHLLNNVPAELEVLGALMMGGQKAFKFHDAMQVTQEWFTESRQMLYAAWVKARIVGNPGLVECTNVLAQLGHRHLSDQLDTCVDKFTTVHILPRHLAILQDRMLARRLHNLLSEGIASIDASANAADLIPDIRAQLANMSQPVGENQQTVRDIGTDLIHKYEAAGKGAIFHLPTAFTNVARYTLGNPIGRMQIIGARTSIGKSLYGLIDGIFMAGPPHNIPGVIFNLEMDREEVVERGACYLAKLDAQTLRSGKAHPHDKALFDKAVDHLQNLPIFIIDDIDHLSRLESVTRDMVADAGVRWVNVDYLQLLVGDKKRTNSRREEVTGISNALARMAKREHVHLTAECQLKRREEEGRYVKEVKIKHPILSDLRESGDIEQDAYTVVLLSVESSSADKTILRANVAKNRGGETGIGYLVHRKTQMRIEDQA